MERSEAAAAAAAWVSARALAEADPGQAAVRWPTLAQMRGLTHARRSNLGRQLKLALGLAATWPHRPGFEATLRALPHWQPLFARSFKSFEPLVQAFVDRRFGASRRLAHLKHDLALATEVFGARICQRIAEGERIPLWRLGDQAIVTLGLNTVSMREGLWALHLVTPEGARVCHMSFSFLLPDRLAVGAVQGPALEDEAALAAIRTLTKEAEGLRPAHLLVEVLRVLCRRWSLQLVGVDPCHHPKKKWHHRELRVAFDYRNFWGELGGALAADGLWALPSDRIARDLAEVPSKRRAMYRRREQLLERMSSQLLHALPEPSGLHALRSVQRKPKPPVRDTSAHRRNRGPWITPYRVGLALAMAAVGITAWSTDFIAASAGERTVYTATCEDGVWLDDHCSGRLAAGERYRFRPLRKHREVVFWTAGGSDSSGKFTGCEIVDGDDWRCPPNGQESATVTLQMVRGRPVRDEEADTRPLHAIPKWRWSFAKWGLPIGGEADAAVEDAHR